MNETKGKRIRPKKDHPARWDARKHQPTKAEIEADMSIPCSPDQLLEAVINYGPNKAKGRER